MALTMAKNMSTMTRRGSSTGATICLDPALRLEAKLLQPVHAQYEVGNLMFPVGPQCGDRLFNPVFRNSGAPEKRPEPVLRGDAKFAVASWPEHDVVGRGSSAPDPKTAQAMRRRPGPLLLPEGRRHRVAMPAGRSDVQTQDPGK